jgi:UDPglucose 6-dehydrogenase
MKVCVFGAGYVGLVSAACLADMGNSVVGVDSNPDRVAELNEGRIPIHEPGLDALIERNTRAGRLRFTTDAEDGVRHGTIIFIAVGTPPAEDGSADLQHVLAVAETIGRFMQDHKIIVNKSTVPVGTADRVKSVVAGALRERSALIPYAVVSNPEFLKEGAAIDDFLRPDRVVLGVDDERAEWLLRSLYAPFLRNRDRLLVMDLRSAEMTKYVANAMLASRISFMNEMAGLADALGADIEKVRVGIGSDERIGTHFLYAGCGWGGSCFPKDVRALEQMADAQGVTVELLRATRSVNERQRRLLGDCLLERLGPSLRGVRIALWGLAFKPGTDDMREATSVTLIEQLIDAGATIVAYDPVARGEAERRWAGHPQLILCDDAHAACDGADALAVVTEWREFRSPDFVEIRRRMRGNLLLDGRNLYEPIQMSEMGFDHVGIGRGTSSWMLPRLKVTGTAGRGETRAA